MGRKKKGARLNDKLDKYLNTYELDEMNEANDTASLVQLCQLEINIEDINESLGNIKDKVIDSKKVRELNSALRDATQNYTSLQQELGISRKKRQSDSEESPLQFIDNLQQKAKKFLDSRLVSVICPACGQLLGKYIFYVNQKGEEGSIESQIKPVEPYRHTVRFECWKCAKNKVVSFAEDSNESILFTEK
jgi:hypothetical protein